MGREGPQGGGGNGLERENLGRWGLNNHSGPGEGWAQLLPEEAPRASGSLTRIFIRPGLGQFLRQVMSKVRVLRWSFLK